MEIPRKMKPNPLIGRYCGWLNLGVITTVKTARQDMVITARKKFLALNTGSQANAYMANGYPLPIIKKQMPPKSSLNRICLTLWL
jgi:hypothetical protein